MGAGYVSISMRTTLELMAGNEADGAAGVGLWVAAQGPGAGRETERPVSSRPNL